MVGLFGLIVEECGGEAGADSPAERYWHSLCSVGSPRAQCPGPVCKNIRDRDNAAWCCRNVPSELHMKSHTKTQNILIKITSIRLWFKVVYSIQSSPVDVGIADTACEVFEATAWRPSIIEDLYSWSWWRSCSWWRTFLFLFVFVIHQQRIPVVNS